MGLALLFGIVFGYWGLMERQRRVLGLVPPQELTLQSLIQNGPGTNRHVTLTGFRAGGYAAETKSGGWTGVWVALFPTGPQTDAGKEIKAVLSSKAVKDEDALRRLVQSGRVTGICSEAPRSGWGGELGPKLSQANQGCQLSSAWEIEELREPPSAALVMGLLTGSAGCFAVVLILAPILFWKAA
jgi:hypothetical protein